MVPDATLVVSYLGYNTQEVPVNNRSQITIVLQENAVALQEVVAIGYGTVRKSDATGSVTLVKPDEINAGLATSAQDLLVGKTPGVVVTLNGGKPEGGADIRIRGGSSLNATNDPLIVIDGVPVDNSGVTGMSNSLSMISPDNIESFTILKDASATAIYGSRASNGVIIITTKRGQSGKPQINFTANMYVNTPRNKVGVLDGDQFRRVITDYYGEGSPAYNLLGTANTNWQDEILRTSVSSDYNLSVGGTYKILPYRIAVSYTNQNGILKTSAMDRVTASITLNPKFFDNTLSVTANVKGFYMHNRFADEGAIGGAVSFDPSQSVRVDNLPIGNGYFTWLKPGTDEFIGIAPVNPVSLIDERSMKADVYRSVGNLQLDYVMPFLPALHANLNLGYDVSHSIQHNLMTPDSPLTYKENKKTGLGQDERLRQLKRNLLLDFYLNYKQDFESIHSRLDAMAGYSWQRFYKDGGTRTTLMPDKEQWFVSSYTDHLQLISFFGRVNYTYKDTYLFTVTLRGDATSRFSKDNRWGAFPAVALGWKIINEPFMERATSFMSELKLRLGYGITGQQDISDSYFPYMPLFTIGYPTASYPFGDQYYTIRPNGYDPNIKWEETTTWNAGIDFGFLNNRITGSLDYYYRETNDLISRIPVPAGSNLTNEIYTNVGRLRNEGIEFNIQAKVIDNKDFTWDLGMNVAWNSNKITKLNKSESADYYIPVGGIGGGTGNTVQAHKVGYPAYSYLLYEQVYDADGNPIEGLYADRNGDGVIDESDKYIHHSRDPKVVIGINSTMNWKNFDFGISLRANLGNYVYDNVLSQNSIYSAMYNSAGFLSNIMRRGAKFETQQYMSDYYLKNAGFLRCDNISLGYTWKHLLDDALRLRVYGAVQNPFVITKYKGLDPEVFSGIDNNVYPRPTTYTLGVVLAY